jgi:hypothetical protein
LKADAAQAWSTAATNAMAVVAAVFTANATPQDFFKRPVHRCNKLSIHVQQLLAPFTSFCFLLRCSSVLKRGAARLTNFRNHQMTASVYGKSNHPHRHHAPFGLTSAVT